MYKKLDLSINDFSLILPKIKIQKLIKLFDEKSSYLFDFYVFYQQTKNIFLKMDKNIGFSVISSLYFLE